MNRPGSGFQVPGCGDNSGSSSRASGRYRLVLASASPQRRNILLGAGYAFEAFDPGEVEDAVAAAPTPGALAIAKARCKAREVAAQLKGPFPAVVVGVDTLVAAGDSGDIIGKPFDRIDAARILARLSGTRHRVISGVCLWLLRQEAAGEKIYSGAAPVQGAATTWVTMRKMPPQEIDAYVASGEADGKAGAYAVQESGDKFVEKMDGSFLNVVGFPLEMFQELLRDAEREWELR